MVDNYKYSIETGRIIGAAMKVHRSLGGVNFPEKIFQRALFLELSRAGFLCESEKEFPVYYENDLIGKKRLDLLVNGKIIVELKAVGQIERKDCNQIINQLRIFDIEVGLLINFGKPTLQFKRFVNNRCNHIHHKRNHIKSAIKCLTP